MPPGTVQAADFIPSHYTPAQAQLILGGEVSMWGDDVNADIIEAFVWRGAAALAERLWSRPSALRNPRHNNAPTVRLAQHSCRMRMRGMAVGPTQAGWCPADSLPPPPEPSRDQQQNELSVLRREVARLRKENAALRQSRPLKLDDNPRMRDSDGEHSAAITVLHPRGLPASIPAQRRTLGLRGDYKVRRAAFLAFRPLKPVCSQPWITELATGELLLVHRCASVLSSPPVVYNTYQDCREDHLVLLIGTADGSDWTRTQHVHVSSPTPARDILGGEFAVHTLSDGTVFLHAGCSYWRSRNHGRSFSSNTTWNCTLCRPAVSSGSGQRCGGHGSAWGLVEVATHGEAPPGLYFFGASSTP